MEKILLAIDGIAADNRVFNYAVALRKRMRTGLDILQILRPQSCRRYLAKVRRGARNACSLFENNMVAATFAEAGLHHVAEHLKTRATESLNYLLQEADRDGINYHIVLKSVNHDEEIVRYVNDHRDVVLTIYDASGAMDACDGAHEEKMETALLRIGRKISTPLVTMREI